MASAEDIKKTLEEYYRESWETAAADNRETIFTGESYLIGVHDGRVETIGEIFTMLYGEQAMMELWQSVYFKEG